MIFVYGILPLVLLAESFKLCQANLFGKKSIELTGTLENVRDVIVNTEIWNLAEGQIKSILVTREDPYDLGIDTPCESPSTKWLQEQTELVSEDDLQKIIEWDLFIIPFAYKLYIDVPHNHSGTFIISNVLSTDKQEYFGTEGEFTKEINNIFEDAQDFWAGSGVEDDIHIRGAHGADLADLDKLIPTLELLFKGSYDDDYTVYDHANEIQELILRLPGGYNFPLLTFNAFATDKMDDTDPSIIIGDGYFNFQKASSSESEGPEYVLTHEFAHHVMYAMGLSLEDYKKEELMADAFAAYFLAHNNGGGMTSSEISNIHKVAFSVGDCETSDAFHHGTPRQRTCATVFGTTHAEEGRRLNARQLYSKFSEWYSDIEEMDENCVPITSASSGSSMNALLSLMIPVLWSFH